LFNHVSKSAQENNIYFTYNYILSSFNFCNLKSFNVYDKNYLVIIRWVIQLLFHANNVQHFKAY